MQRQQREAIMARYYITDEHGLFTADIETSGTVLSNGMDDERAASVFGSALFLAMATLAQGGDWPSLALEHLRDFMQAMQNSVQTPPLM